MTSRSPKQTVNHGHYTRGRLAASSEIRLLVLQSGWYGHGPLRGHLIKRSLDKSKSTLRDDEKYAALSYTWGTPEFTAQIELKPSGSFAITQNLSEALKELRNPKRPVTLWIDQICINQHDLEEKAIQVQMMDRIYRQAEIVRIWLGPKTKSSTRALAFADQFNRAIMKEWEIEKKEAKSAGHGIHDSKPYFAEEKVDPHRPRLRVVGVAKGSAVTSRVGSTIASDAPTGPSIVPWNDPNSSKLRQKFLAMGANSAAIATLLGKMMVLPRTDHVYRNGEAGIFPARDRPEWMALQQLLSRPWFTRVWIIQEVILAEAEPIIHIGNETIKWSYLRNLLRLMRVHLPAFFFGPHTEVEQGLPAEIILDMDMTRWVRDEGFDVHLHNLMYRYRRSQASEPRDKIFSLYSISGVDGPLSYSESCESLYLRYMTTNLSAIGQIVQGYVGLGPFSRDTTFEFQTAPAIPSGGRSRFADLILSAGLSKQVLDIPSWVPDWSFCNVPLTLVPRAPERYEKYAGGHEVMMFETRRVQQYLDAKSSSMRPNEKPALAVIGKIIGSISGTTASHILVGEPLDTLAQQVVLKSWFLEATSLASSHGRLSDIARTEFIDLITNAKWRSKAFLHKSEYINNPKPYNNAAWLDFSRSEAYIATMPFRIPIEVYWESAPYIMGRSLVCLVGGGCALAPYGTMSEDMVALIAGVDLPVVIRGSGEGTYCLIGECSMLDSDVMDGNVWDDIVEPSSLFAGKPRRVIELI